MSSGKLSGYKLTPSALADFDDIWRYTAETWSVEQADSYVDDLTQIFEIIVGMPSLARERREVEPPIRIHVHRSHLIIYRIVESHIEIVRLLGGRQDWLAVLKATDPL